MLLNALRFRSFFCWSCSFAMGGGRSVRGLGGRGGRNPLQIWMISLHTSSLRLSHELFSDVALDVCFSIPVYVAVQVHFFPKKHYNISVFQLCCFPFFWTNKDVQLCVLSLFCSSLLHFRLFSPIRWEQEWCTTGGGGRSIQAAASFVCVCVSCIYVPFFFLFYVFTLSPFCSVYLSLLNDQLWFR
jgi:hypothetical protein